MKNNQTEKTVVITHTINWLEQFIIKYSICPFARKEHENNSIRYTIVNDHSLEEQLTALIDECLVLDTCPEVETSLLIFPDSFPGFDDYLDYCALAEELLAEHHYEGIYQIASFHPQYQFDQTHINDAENYTNRSPYPMIHLIREKSIEIALEHFPEPENIPLRNIELTRQLGREQLESILQQCYVNKENNDN
ncbi:MAG: DUF1415 domain-containing protein [Gammaproteobacteria bacterium]|nr:DUF1415 domain-containing protein [Gammaproteobacteria bacterium]